MVAESGLLAAVLVELKHEGPMTSIFVALIVLAILIVGWAALDGGE